MIRLALVLAVLALAPAAAPADAAEWRSEQPLGPEGRTALGAIGDIQCWQPNRCVLISGGNGGMPAGVYAYDGTGWYLYSTVCGGAQGRIAWAGPTDFWTVSDQQLGQETEVKANPSISLCHFSGGEIIASYAQPIGVAGSYLTMNAAACLGPDECWFAGKRLPGTVNVGAFHLYWNGLSLTDFPSLTEPQPELIEDPGREVVSLAYHRGALYEGVRAREDDVAPGEPPGQPYFIHRILPGTVPAFLPQVPTAPISYGGPGAKPTQLGGFLLAGDDQALWGVSGSEAAPAGITVLRLGDPGFEQVHLSDASSTFSPGDRVGDIAVEPGSNAVWVGFRHSTDLGTPPARLALVHSDGTVDPAVTLPPEGEGVGPKGETTAIECAAAEQCWVGTKAGWLFHLGPDLPQDTEPAMHTLISIRPPDASLPSVPPVSLPEDNSGAYLAPEIPLRPEEGGTRTGPRTPPLYSKVTQHLIGGRIIELSFTLREKSKVKLVAKRRGHTVAATRRYTMAKGRQRIRLRLDPDRWPTKLDLQVHPVKKAGAK